jgi:hypothetical protein
VRKNSLYSIGAPGRAALELPIGPPTARVGSADVELSAASLAGMLVLAATSRGLEHRAAGTPRQDAFALAHRGDRSETSWVIAVVCDGVGEFTRSDDAAMFVSRRLASLGAAGVPWPEAFARVNDELTKVANEALAADAADGMATTAVAVVVRQEAGQWLGEAAWVGDSTLWHLDTNARWTLVTCPSDDDGDPVYHSTNVTPLPSADGTCASCDFRLDGGALFVMSDGVANPLKWSHDVQGVLAEWWARPPDPFTFAAQVGFARKSHMDDRTVIGIWPDGGDADAGSEADASKEIGSGATDPPG